MRDRKYTENLMVKITNEMKERLQYVADKNDKSVSDYVRDLIMKATKKEG